MRSHGFGVARETPSDAPKIPENKAWPARPSQANRVPIWNPYGAVPNSTKFCCT